MGLRGAGATRATREEEVGSISPPPVVRGGGEGAMVLAADIPASLRTRSALLEVAWRDRAQCLGTRAACFHQQHLPFPGGALMWAKRSRWVRRTLGSSKYRGKDQLMKL